MNNIQTVMYSGNRQLHSASNCNFKTEVGIHSTEKLDLEDFVEVDRISSHDSLQNNTITMIRSDEKTTNVQMISNNPESGYSSVSVLDDADESRSSRLSEDETCLNVCSEFQHNSNDTIAISQNKHSTSKLIPENSFLVKENDTTSPLLQKTTFNSKDNIASDKSILRENIFWGLLISLLLNTVLISSCIYVSYGIRAVSKSKFHIENSFPSSLCVLDQNENRMCSNHSMHLRYLLEVINIKQNDTRTVEVAQSILSFSKHSEDALPQKALIENTRCSQHQVTNRSVMKIQDSKVIIGHSGSYLISSHLIFKSESRWNYTTHVYTVHIKKNTTSSTQTTLMVKKVPIFKGGLSLQSVNLIGQFKLKSGDSIGVEVFPPEFVYSCKGCNILSMMRIK